MVPPVNRTGPAKVVVVVELDVEVLEVELDELDEVLEVELDELDEVLEVELVEVVELFGFGPSNA